MKITPIRDTVASYREYLKRSRCEAEVTDVVKNWRIRAGKDDRCERHALYIIDDKALCKLHSDDYLLKLALEGKLRSAP